MVIMLTKRQQCGRRYKRQRTISSLDKALWKVFSLYIRHRDSRAGYCQCISCGKWNTTENMDAGHFISRNKKATKYNEQNVNSQCRKCNRFLSGRQFEHGLNIDIKYGRGTAEKLLALSTQKCKLTPMWYEEMIRIYKEKLKGAI